MNTDTTPTANTKHKGRPWSSWTEPAAAPAPSGIPAPPPAGVARVKLFGEAHGYTSGDWPRQHMVPDPAAVAEAAGVTEATARKVMIGILEAVRRKRAAEAAAHAAGVAEMERLRAEAAAERERQKQAERTDLDPREVKQLRDLLKGGRAS